MQVPFRILKILVMLRCEDDQGGGYHSFEERIKSYCSQMFFDKQEHIKMKINTIIKKDPLTFLKFFVEYLSMVVKMNLMPHNRVVMISSLIIFTIIGWKIVYHTNEDCSQTYFVPSWIWNQRGFILCLLNWFIKRCEIYISLFLWKTKTPMLVCFNIH